MKWNPAVTPGIQWEHIYDNDYKLTPLLLSSDKKWAKTAFIPAKCLVDLLEQPIFILWQFARKIEIVGIMVACKDG